MEMFADSAPVSLSRAFLRSEEHTSELQSQFHLVCRLLLEKKDNDRYSSHAPFHFDLYILDIYVSLKPGVTLVIVEEELGKAPSRLAPWIAGQKLTVWDSAS